MKMKIKHLTKGIKNAHPPKYQNYHDSHTAGEIYVL